MAPCLINPLFSSIQSPLVAGDASCAVTLRRLHVRHELPTPPNVDTANHTHFPTHAAPIPHTKPTRRVAGPQRHRPPPPTTVGECT